LLHCRACRRSSYVDLQALIDQGKGDTPLVHLRWRCSDCGSRRINVLVAPNDDVLRPVR
jgi:hypothetical protein